MVFAVIDHDGDQDIYAAPAAASDPPRGLSLVDALRAFATEKGLTVAQVTIAWVLSRGSNLVPLVGARRRDRLTEALGALEANLTTDDLARIERAVPQGAASGDR